MSPGGGIAREGCVQPVQVRAAVGRRLSPGVALPEQVACSLCKCVHL